MREIGTEGADRQEEIAALVRMAGYAANVASEIGAAKAAIYLEAARAALLTVLESELPNAPKEQIDLLLGRPTGNC